MKKIPKIRHKVVDHLCYAFLLFLGLKVSSNEEKEYERLKTDFYNLIELLIDYLLELNGDNEKLRNILAAHNLFIDPLSESEKKFLEETVENNK